MAHDAPPAPGLRAGRGAMDAHARDGVDGCGPRTTLRRELGWLGQQRQAFGSHAALHLHRCCAVLAGLLLEQHGGGGSGSCCVHPHCLEAARCCCCRGFGCLLALLLPRCSQAPKPVRQGRNASR